MNRNIVYHCGTINDKTNDMTEITAPEVTTAFTRVRDEINILKEISEKYPHWQITSELKDFTEQDIDDISIGMGELDSIYHVKGERVHFNVNGLPYVSIVCTKNLIK